MKEHYVGMFTLPYYFCRYSVFIFVDMVSLLSVIPFEMAFCTNTAEVDLIGCKAISNLRSELHYKA